MPQDLSIDTDQLSIAYREVGPSAGKPVFLMHGFPYDVNAYNRVSVQLAERGYRCIVPFLRGYGATLFKSPQIMRSGQQAAWGADLLALMDALNIAQAIVGGYDWGGRAACIVAALWPQRVIGLVSCGTGYNIQNIAAAGKPAAAAEEYRYWYQYYFHTERGRRALAANRHELCEFIWRLWSPSWNFDQATYAQTATAFDNPDFVDIVIHSYRHRFGGIAGDPVFDGIEQQLAAQPKITVPSIVLQGDDDAVDPPSGSDTDAPFFSGPYQRRRIPAVGHNLPQEAPGVFTEAVIALEQ